MQPKLHFILFEDLLTDDPPVVDFIRDPEDLAIRWSLPGGIQKFEVIVRPDNAYDDMNRYRTHIGLRAAIHDSHLNQPVCTGWVYEVQLLDATVKYICAGTFQRHKERYDFTDPTDTDTIDEVVGDILDNYVPAVSADRTQISASTTAIGAWTPNLPDGLRVDRSLKELAEMGEGAVRWDYWTQTQPGALRLDIPYFAPQTPPTAADWIVLRQDLQRLKLSRHIWDLKRDVTIRNSGADATATSTETDLWVVEDIQDRSRFTNAQAQNYADMLIDTFESQVQQQSFTISAPRIMDSTGNFWPLWEVVRRGRTTIGIQDLQSAADRIDLSQGPDSFETFWIVSMDYRYRTNTLRITPDTEDSRLDALLKRAGVIENEIV